MTQRIQRLRRAIFVSLALFVSAMLGITGYTLWRLHAAAITNGLEISEMHTRSFEDYLTQSLHATELAATNAVPGRNGAANPRDIERSFLKTLQHSPQLRSMSLLDEHQRIIASSNPANIGVSVATGSYLPPSGGRQELLRIGSPWAGRDFADGRPSSADTPVEAQALGFIPFTRTLTIGSRDMTLLFALNPDYFINHISQEVDAGMGEVKVLRYDGTILMDTDPAGRIGAIHDYVVRDLKLSEVESGKFEQVFHDGRRELTAYRSSRLYPFVVITHIHPAYALRKWQSEAKTLLAVVIPALLAITLLAFAYYRRQLLIEVQRTEAARLQRINATVFDASAESIIITDLNANIISVNPAFSRISGYGAEEVLGRNPRLLASGKQDRLFYEQMWQEISRSGSWQGELTNRHKNGSYYDIHLSITAAKDEMGRLQHYIGVSTDITERKRAEQTIQRESEKNRALLRNTSDGIHILDSEGSLIDFSDSFCAMLGYSREEMAGMNVNQWDVHFEAPGMEGVFKQRFRHGPPPRIETQHRRKDGSVIDVEISLLKLDLDGIPVDYCSSRDITERKRAEHELRIAATAFETQEGILIADAAGNILRVNRAFTDITGYTPQEVIGKNPRILSSGLHDASFYSAMWDDLLREGAWKGEIWNRRKNGEVYPERLTITTVKNRDGAIVNYVASLADITLHKAAEEEIKTLAFFDTLTRLPNRRLLLDRLQQALVASMRSDKSGAILFLDLDNFKNLNDTLGHDIGDLLLQQVAERLHSCVREGDTVARIGGDEFVVILEDLSTEAIEAAAQTETVGWKIISSLNQPYQLNEYEAHSTPSIGATLFDGRPQLIDDLFKQADIAMYQAKKAGRNTMRFFDPQMQDTLNIRAAIETDLRKSIERRQFQLYYQIQVDDKRRPLGAEALIRWIHPERGMVSPDQFIPLAEETGLILSIGQWVLESACAQLKEWERNPLARDLVLAVNVSAKQFRQNDFAARVREIVQRFAINPARLKLELTESMLQEDIEDTIAIMNSLKEIGVLFSLDDFGTGYSSLQYIKRLPLDQIKIDQSFVHDLGMSNDDRAIVKAIIAMARSLDMEVIAEGVETENQRSMLISNGCFQFQGYLFSKPVPVEQFGALLE
jgi:diguanylate cyclase (GGDEF)-like protein/PAS domain S-box-containing protein